MENMPVDWEHIREIDPDGIHHSRDTEDGVSLVFKDGTQLHIEDKIALISPYSTFYEFEIEEAPPGNAFHISVGRRDGDDSYSWVSLTIRIGPYRYFQHSFVEGTPDLDANNVCALRVYKKEENAWR